VTSERVFPSLAGPGFLTDFFSWISVFEFAHFQEELMDTEIVGQLGMECCEQYSPVSNKHRVAFVEAENFTIEVFGSSFDDRRADKDSVKGRLERRQKQLGVEAVNLASIGVSSHLDVHDLQPLRPFSSLSQQNGSRAGPEDRQAVSTGRSERIEEPATAGEILHRSAFAAGDDQSLDVLEVLRLPNSSGLHSAALETGDVKREGSLQGEHADGRLGRPRQIREAPGVYHPRL